MRVLLRDLDRQLKTLRQRGGRLDAAGARQLDRILKRQSSAWADLTALLDSSREAARLAANRNASEEEKHLLRLLTPAERKRVTQGPAFSRADSAEVARRVSHSRDFARKLLIRNINRQKGGRDIANTVKGQLSPATKGGVSYVAKRLVRTETAMAYHQAQIQRAAETPWVKGLRWITSPDHSHVDVCDLYARKGIYSPDKVPDLPHPLCMCTVKPVLMSETEFKRALADGAFDSYLGRSAREAGTKALRKG